MTILIKYLIYKNKIFYILTYIIYLVKLYYIMVANLLDASVIPKTMFAIVDCDNFYVSCERVFNPALNNQPVIILSNNDGCCIARSNEAKALGIKMATPIILLREIIKEYKIICLSSNYELYGDMSNRVMDILSNIEPTTFMYSVDEAFLDLSHLSTDYLEIYAKHIRQNLLQHLGIPTSIGIAPTKTLAKIASIQAKSNSLGIKIIYNSDECLSAMQMLKVQDIWGIGRQYAKTLPTFGIKTAFDLCMIDDGLLNCFNILVKRTVNELRGLSCLELEDLSNKRTITYSRSFGRIINKIAEMDEAISTYTAKACVKLRNQNGVVDSVYVFMQTCRYTNQLYHYGCKVSLPYPTNDTIIILQHVLHSARKIFNNKKQYKKAGVTLLDIHAYDSNQLSFSTDLSHDNRRLSLMQIIDKINKNFGSNSVQFAVEGIAKPWRMRRLKLSPAYTTKWSDIPIVR